MLEKRQSVILPGSTFTMENSTVEIYFDANLPVNMVGSEQSSNISEKLVRFSPSDEFRGKCYDKYMQKRDAKLLEEWGSRKAEKEEKMKAMHDNLERTQAEIRIKFAGSADRNSHRRAEKLRSSSSRSSSRNKNKYRDIVRQFIKGTDGFAGDFAQCLCGSPNIYQAGARNPWHSINFICAHDGFTLADLVTYNNKYNLSNGEDNRDGENHNLSWNCGEEGELVSVSVKRLRRRQMRNFFLCLMVSQGVPMIYMGDEYGHTKGGNNNTYCHDNFINYFRWDKKEESSSDFYRFCRLMTKFRSECESLGLDEFPTGEQLQWHGHQAGMPDWSESSRFVAFTMIDAVKGEIYVAFNTSHLPATVKLPQRPGSRWAPLVDTSKPAPYDFLSDDLPDRDIAAKQYANFLDSNLYPMLSYSSVILILQPDA